MDNFSQNVLKIKYAEFLNPFIWTGTYNILKHHQVYMDMIKEFELVGLEKPTKEQQAIDFLYSLSPEFTTIQAELRNNENRVRAMPATSATQRSLREVADLLPKTLSADFKYARQYVGSSYFMRPPTIDESANVSNSNYASTNSNKQQGKSRKRYKNKKPRPILLVEVHHLKAVEMEVTLMKSSRKRKISRRRRCIAIFVITLTITLVIAIG